MQPFDSYIDWASEVWITELTNPMIEFNEQRFLVPYLDLMPARDYTVTD